MCVVQYHFILYYVTSRWQFRIRLTGLIYSEEFIDILQSQSWLRFVWMQGGKSLSAWAGTLGWIVPSSLDHRRQARAGAPSTAAEGRRPPASSLPWPGGAETSGRSAELRAHRLRSPSAALASRSAPCCVAAHVDVIHLSAIFKVSNCPVQYFDNIFFLNSSFYASPKLLLRFETPCGVKKILLVPAYMLNR